MVGSETVRVDDPVLTCRIPRGRDPLRVVVDGRLRTSPRARVVRQRSDASTIVLTTASAAPARRRALERAGTEVIALAARGGRVDLAAAMRRLAERGVVSVLIEGGGGLAAAALRARVVDEVLVVTAPMLIGGDGRPMLAALGVARLARAPRIVDVRVTRLGPDVLHAGTVAY